MTFTPPSKNRIPSFLKPHPMRQYLTVVILSLLIYSKTHATTWDEPWAEKVIKESTSFVLAKVLSSNDEGIRIVIIKTLGGESLKDTLLINGFYALRLCSTTGGHGPEFDVAPVDSCYFFIRNENNKYRIATPTTGFDYVEKGRVVATYRHSYHQASVPVSVYEQSMTAIFNNYHNLAWDKTSINAFIKEYLAKSPAGFEETQVETFFLQHVALELVFHLKLTVPEAWLLPFLNDKNNFHNQVSAARAMAACNTKEGKQQLLQAIEDTTRRNFVRVICVWSLASMQPEELLNELKRIESTASEERDTFGGNIMDPRICTNIPVLKDALAACVKKLESL